MQVTDEMVMAHAVEDAKFAGKPFDTLGRADRARYLQRSRLCLQAAAALVDVPAEPVGYLFELFYPGSDRWSGQMFSDHNPTANLPAEHIRNVRPLYTAPPLSREGEDSAEVEQTVGSHEITDFLYKHGDLTYSAAARAVQLLTGNGYGFTASSEARKESLLTMRKALNKIADMIDAEDADLDDAINIATTALAATRSGPPTTANGVGGGE